MVLLDFSITPLGMGESVSQFVARAVDVIDKSGLNYRLHAMGTTVEGELDQVLSVLKQCIEALAADCHRITVTAKIDYRRNHPPALESKATKVEQLVGRKLKK